MKRYDIDIKPFLPLHMRGFSLAKNAGLGKHQDESSITPAYCQKGLARGRYLSKPKPSEARYHLQWNSQLERVRDGHQLRVVPAVLSSTLSTPLAKL
jgi:hypothetical protein